MNRLMWTRFRLCLLFLAVAAYAQQATTPGQSDGKQVVFVCEHGAAKSVIAAAYFNKLAQERGLSQRAVARGTQPDTEYSPAVIRNLKADGVAVQPGKPAKVTKEEVAGAERVVTLGCQLPSSTRAAKPLEDWGGLPAVGENYPAARDAIKAHVEELVKKLSTERR